MRRGPAVAPGVEPADVGGPAGVVLVRGGEDGLEVLLVVEVVLGHHRRHELHGCGGA